MPKPESQDQHTAEQDQLSNGAGMELVLPHLKIKGQVNRHLWRMTSVWDLLKLHLGRTPFMRRGGTKSLTELKLRRYVCLHG